MFAFSDYTQMKQDFQSQVKKLLAVNDKIKVGKTKVEDLEEPRRHQVLFLEQCRALLENYTPKDKSEDVSINRAKVITGAMYVIYDEILETYRLRDPLYHSGLYAGLQVAMGITTANPMDAFSQRNMLELLDQFMIFNIHVGSKLRNDLRLDHPFAAIPNFDLNSFSQRLINLRAAACSKLKDEQHAKLNLAEKQAKQQPAEPGASYLGRFWSSAQASSKDVLSETASVASTSLKKEDFPPLSASSTNLPRV